MHLQDKDISTASPIADEIRTNKDFKPGDPKSRGMNNEEKKADKARKEGKTGDVANASKQGETSHGEFKSGDSKSRGMNNAEKKADKAARAGKVQHRDEPPAPSKANEQKSPSSSKSASKSAAPPGNEGLTEAPGFKKGDPKSRGMNNEEKRADKAAREGKTQQSSGSGPSKSSPSKSASKSAQPDTDDLRHGSFQAGDPDSRGMNNEEKKADSARRAGKSGAATNPDKQAETSHGTYYAGNPNSRGMNNEEKKADKARREGKMPLDQGAGRANDKDVVGSIEEGTPMDSGQPTKPQREKSTMSTGPGGAGQGEGMTPNVNGGGYERYGSYEGTAIVSDSVAPGKESATPLNDVDMYGSEEPALGKERQSTLESEASVVVAGESEEEAPFGNEDKKTIPKSGLEEAERASRAEKPARQSSRIKQTGGGKRKMQEGRESEGLLVSEDEERVKKASKKEVGPGI